MTSTTRRFRKAKKHSHDVSVPASMQPKPLTKTTVMVVMVLAAIYFMLPVWWLVVQSTKSYGEMLVTHPLWFAEDNSFAANVRDVTTYDGGNFARWVINSIFYSGTTAFIGTLISLSCGYSFSKFRYRGKKILLGMILVGMLLPASLLTIPMFYLFNWMGLVNTVWAIIIPCSVSPFGVFLGMIYCDTIPTELIEAARIDGAGELRIFFGIVIRLLGPAVVTIALFIFVATWNNFLLPLVMLRGKELLPVTLGLYTWQNYKAEILTAQVLTGSLLGVIPVIILFLLLQRYWRAGLAQGSVKA
ncbi:carbohydrate ABC transporter permease [Corynebacterium mendelii]|uniref:Carbohydrate ABC transporter permease n=1 Tax=Corynebacterium mendelii TaxID=2765362 RepID=A0A939DYM5_9CORY|nr:carbohydrate ABC transporter permease [Corynebacterium mendelii]MBN9643230.1 carbohydrate ABC transporter permease [Corynebacterium mendelii]